VPFVYGNGATLVHSIARVVSNRWTF